MTRNQTLWLVFNRASGSNDEAALAELETALGEAGFAIARRTCFPDEPAPDAAALNGADIDTLCVFAGDGTIHSVVTELFGWTGRILVLPGGTMNMLSRRIHGDLPPGEIVARIAAGGMRLVRPTILKCAHGFALTGALAGPGAQWNNVREAMRHGAVTEFGSAATEAAVESISAERVSCHGLEELRPEGYAAVAVTPMDEGIEIKGYYAQGVADYISQIVAMVQGDFRNGPHDELGIVPSVDIESLDGEPMRLLMDGEPHDGLPCERFEIVPCGVDLIAAADGV
jgi:diacylglycerol kinase family enzyme